MLLAWLGQEKAEKISHNGQARAGRSSRQEPPPETGKFEATAHTDCNLERFGLPICINSHALLLRIPSKCLPIIGQTAGGQLLSGDRLDKKAAIGLAGRRLIANLRR